MKKIYILLVAVLCQAAHASDQSPQEMISSMQQQLREHMRTLETAQAEFKMQQINPRFIPCTSRIIVKFVAIMGLLQKQKLNAQQKAQLIAQNEKLQSIIVQHIEFIKQDERRDSIIAQRIESLRASKTVRAQSAQPRASKYDVEHTSRSLSCNSLRHTTGIDPDELD